jgi:hypothetical protein
MHRFRLSTLFGAVTLACISLALVRINARYPDQAIQEAVDWYSPGVLAVIAALWGARSYRGRLTGAGVVAGIMWGAAAAAFQMALTTHSIAWGLMDSRDWFVVHVSWMANWQFMRLVVWQGLFGALIGAGVSFLLSSRWFRPGNHQALSDAQHLN